ncbi:MAG: HAMP domain-containing sensor histidine kinase, partial [Armatimonadota bacterium]|nr:HAMP domain-containing sensor histidine kinase [Armatimonadota bacterium]
RDDVAAILAAVSELPKMKRVAILNGRGETLVSPTAEADHRSPRISGLRFAKSPVSFEVPGDIYRTINAVENDRPCMRCHGSQAKALGYLVIDRSISDIRSARDIDRRQILVVGILTVIVICVAIQIVLSRLVHAPVSALMATMSRVSRGDETARADEKDRGEFASLSKTFNSMLADLDAKNKEVVEAHDRLAQTERLASIGLLAAGVAHQIGNPLATISISAEALGESPDAGRNRFTRAIVTACGTISSILTELLSFDKLRGMNLSEVPIARLVEDAIAESESMRKPGQVIEKKVATDGVMIYCDERQLHRALVNIVVNGLQAMPDGGTLTVSAGRRECSARVEISDTGPGMPEDLLPGIFEPFSTTKDFGEGSGLGLAIARETVRRHNGDIGAFNRPDGGAVVWLEIPLKEGCS